MIFKENFSTRISELRKAARLKQSELGKFVGLSHDSISDIERGKALTNIETLTAFARIFNVSFQCSTDFLLCLSDNKTSDGTSGNCETEE